MYFYHFQIDIWIFFDALILRAEKGQIELLAKQFFKSLRKVTNTSVLKAHSSAIYYRSASFCIGYERATPQEYKNVIFGNFCKNLICGPLVVKVSSRQNP